LFPQGFMPKQRLCDELTELNCGGQFKPFVYLNCGVAGACRLSSSKSRGKKKSPAFRWGLPKLLYSFVVLTAAALVLLVRVLVRILTLPAWILLLLTRLLTATLLLAGLLAWVLALLTRVLILVGHRDPPFQRHLQQRLELPLVARELAFRWAHYMAAVCRGVADGTDRLKLPCTSRSSGVSRCCRTRLPLLENGTRLGNGSAWIISLSN
jgi:hypothetical protein